MTRCVVNGGELCPNSCALEGRCAWQPDATLRRIAEIEARVRPTIRERFRGHSDVPVERDVILPRAGAITEHDLDALLELAREGVEQREGR